MCVGVNGSTCWLTALHATVDALCACCMFMMEPLLPADSVVFLFVIYNVLAFMTQPLVGLWMDKRPGQTGCLAGAAVLLALGALSAHVLLDVQSPVLWLLIPATLLGMGNALFHVYGGQSLALQTGNDQRRLGIFVSSGAFGIWLGAHYAGMTLLFVLIAVLVVLLWGYLQWGATPVAHASDARREIGQPTRWFLALIVLIVFIRSFMGQMEPAQGRWGTDMLFAAMLLAVAGKAMGGFLAQWWGTRFTLVVALLLSGVFFLLGYYRSVWLLGLVWCLNVTMPLTLGLATQALPRREGLAFGLLAGVLAPGVALATLCSGNPIVYLLLYALVGTLVIELLVLLCLKERRWEVLGVALVMNLLTNLPLNLYLLTHFPDGYPLGVVIGLELGVVVVEAMIYWLVIREVRKSVLYALACNLASCLLPMLLDLISI